MDIGSTLRSARERRHLSLAQISSTTKIPIAHLKSIEDNAFEQVPPGIFIRGFLRAYAQEVGIDPREIISQFVKERAIDLAPPVETPSPAVRAADDERDDRSIEAQISGSGSAWGSVAVVAMLIVAVVALQRYNNGDAPPAPAAESAPAQASAGGDVTGQAGAPVATSGQAAPQGTPQVDLAGGRFQIHAQGPCWVEAVVDGRKLVYRLMQPGDRASVDPERELVLRVGDPAALTYFVNGTPGEPLGKRGVPVTVRFTSEGHRITRAS